MPHILPSLTHHLKQSQVGVAHVIESDFGVDPGIVFVGAFPFVRDLSGWQTLIVIIQAFVELSSEELDPHDGEDEPEHQADQQHIEDGRYGVHQGVHHNLAIKIYTYWLVKTP